MGMCDILLFRLGAWMGTCMFMGVGVLWQCCVAAQSVDNSLKTYNFQLCYNTISQWVHNWTYNKKLWYLYSSAHVHNKPLTQYYITQHHNQYTITNTPQEGQPNPPNYLPSVWHSRTRSNHVLAQRDKVSYVRKERTFSPSMSFKPESREVQGEEFLSTSQSGTGGLQLRRWAYGRHPRGETEDKQGSTYQGTGNCWFQVYWNGSRYWSLSEPDFKETFRWALAW